jgi:molybdopterin-containing oxidoreductase family iron-sulfur binding subunit
MPELDRRQFLKISLAGAGAAVTAACQDPVEKVIPYLNQPEEVVPGIATHYHSTCRECPSSCGITVKTREGRPIKIEGQADDPLCAGAVCVRGQLGLHRTYDPARFRGPMRKQDGRLVPTTWEEAFGLLIPRLQESAGRVFFLGGLETGTLDRLIDRVLAAIGSRERLRYEPFAHEALRAANRALFGRDAVPHFDFESADVLVSFGTDFLETWLNPVQNQRGFTRSRRGGRGYAACVGPRLGLSGSNAQLWFAPEPGSEILVALALAAEVAKAKSLAVPALGSFSADAVAAKTGLEAGEIRALARRIARARAPLALPPGVELQGSNAAAFAAAVQLLNHVSGAIGKTVVFGPDHNLGGLGRFSDLRELAGRLRGGDVKLLLVHGANPVYDAPQVGFADAMANAFVVSFSSANDETTAGADLVLPDHTPFESWGDAEPVAGLRKLQQPTIRPIFDTRALGDVLLEIAGRLGKAEGLPVGSFYDVLAQSWGKADLAGALAAGGSGTPAAATPVAFQPAGLSGLAFESAELGGSPEDLALVVYPSLHFYDGRSQRIPMTNEIPDPVLKTAWGSFAELHPETAERLGVRLGDVVEVKTEAGSLELVAFPHASVRRGVVAIQAGQGHIPVEPDAPDPDWRARRRTTGVNAFSLIPRRLDSQSGARAWYAARASVSSTGKRGKMARAQLTFDQENRGFAQAMTLAAYRAGGAHGHGAEHAAEHGAEHAAPEGVPGANPGSPESRFGIKPLPLQGDAGHLVTKDYEPAKDAHPDSPYRWGMNIDLDDCTGCNACIAACAQENNSPVAGPESVMVGREMFWIRVERWVETAGTMVDVRHAPVMCQHCGAAPCENVCPVLATYHTVEGLNIMVPNRCIGTRFCSNNCPYKVRRFNYWPWDFDYRDPETFGLNPDVMVRSKGVMEKCSMCVQRIHDGKALARSEGRAVRDGDITPACVQTCPSGVLRFGNLRDPESRITSLRVDARAYRILEHLYTRPGVSYQRAILRGEEREA